MIREGVAKRLQSDTEVVLGDIFGAAWTSSKTLTWPKEAREDCRSSEDGGF